MPERTPTQINKTIMRKESAVGVWSNEHISAFFGNATFITYDFA